MSKLKPKQSDAEPTAGSSHVRETIRMLFLSIAQMEIALRESDDEVEHLTDAFTSMVNRETEIANAIDKLSSRDSDLAIHESIKQKAEEVTGKMQGAIIAFQFYDKLTQRLGHVCNSMEELSALLGDDQRIDQTSEWTNLQSAIKSKYSMREEHELFDAVMAGGDVREAINNFKKVKKDDSFTDIELF